MATKVIILQSGDAVHDALVRDNIIAGAQGALIEADINIDQYPQLEDVIIEYEAGDLPDLEMVVGVHSEHSAGQLFHEGAKRMYPKVQTIATLGWNGFTQLSTPYDYVTVVIGVGSSDQNDDETKNYTGYNANLEFYDTFVTPTVNYPASSYSCGFIAGKLWSARDIARNDWGHSDFSWWETRYLFRLYAKRIEDNRTTTMWDLYNGFGRALQITEEEWGYLFSETVKFNRDEIPTDPYLIMDIGEIQGINTNGSVELIWDKVNYADTYRVYRDDTLIYTGSELTFTDTIEKQVNDYLYTYIALDKHGNQTDYSNEFAISYPPFLIATLEEVKAILNITSTSSDTLIKSLLQATDEYIKTQINNTYLDSSGNELTVPKGLKIVFAKFIDYFMKQYNSTAQSESIGDYSISYTSNIPNYLNELLVPYRRVRFI